MDRWIALVFLAILTSAPSALAQQAPTPVHEKPIVPGQVVFEDSAYIAKDTLYAFFNHNSWEFDGHRTTQAATLELDSLMNAHHVPSLMTFDDPNHLFTTFDESSVRPDSTYYLKSKDVTYRVLSQAGAHNVEFQNLKAMIFSGGFLEYCLCEAIRDVARGVKLGSQPIRFYLDSDAIYMDAEVARHFFDIVIDPKEVDRVVSTGAIPLSSAFTFMSNNATVRYLDTYVFNIAFNKFCTIQHTNHLHKDGDLKLADFTFTIKNGNQPIATIGQGPKKLEIIVLSTNALANTLFPQKTANNSVKALPNERPSSPGAAKPGSRDPNPR